MITNLKLKPDYRESLYSQTYIAKERAMVKKMMATVKRKKAKESPPRAQKLEQRRATMIFAEELFSKRFGIPKKEGETNCFIDFAPHRAATTESPKEEDNAK